MDEPEEIEREEEAGVEGPEKDVSLDAMADDELEEDEDEFDDTEADETFS